MPLVDHVTDRFGSASPFLKNLTNHDSRSASTINTDRLAEAASSAQGQFPVHAQVDYDDDNEAHIDAGTLGVIYYLRLWSSAQGKANKEKDAFHDALKGIGSISSRKRITPATGIRPAADGDEDLFFGLSPEVPERSAD